MMALPSTRSASCSTGRSAQLAAAQVGVGVGIGVWGVMWATSVQTQVPGEVLNRIHAYEVACSVGLYPLRQRSSPAWPSAPSAPTTSSWSASPPPPLHRLRPPPRPPHPHPWAGYRLTRA